MSTLTLSPDQKAALDAAVARLEARDQCVALGGYAGTGKTTVTGQIVAAVRTRFPRVAFCCFTGKAYKVLEAKLKATGSLMPNDYCGTIHGLVYNARALRKEKQDAAGRTIIKTDVTFHERDEDDGYDLIVVDEASMVNEELYDRLLQFGAPILAIGDHGQLPPVFGEFNLMANPPIRLTKIHRQAEDDPIIRLSIAAREEGRIEQGDWSADGRICRKIPSSQEGFVNDTVDPLAWAIIVGTNKKRVERNRWARWKQAIRCTEPVAGDRVVCLYNIHAKNVFNGMTGTVTDAGSSEHRAHEYKGKHWISMSVRMDADFDYYSDQVLRYQFHQPKALKETITNPPHAAELDPDHFGHLWDFGYALTCHKAQGSEFDSVVVYEEGAMRHMMERQSADRWRRWLYTAITRAKRQLIIVGE